MALTSEQLTVLRGEIQNDPEGRGYMSPTMVTDARAWNIFNMLRDPGVGRLAALGIEEFTMGIDDVREAMIEVEG